MSVTRSIISGLLIGLAAGCTTIPPASRFMTEEQLIANDSKKQQRSSIVNMSLENKISLVEKNIETNLVKISEGLLLPLYSKGNEKGQIYLDNNALLLSALSAKYAVTKDPRTKKLADSVIKGIIEMDKLNGFDGYIPFIVSPKNFEYTHEVTHVNAYEQLFFAYIHYAKAVGDNPDIKEHISKIYNKFVDSGFGLKNKDGKVIDESDWDVTLFEVNPSRALGRKSLDSIAIKLGDEQTKKRALENAWQGATFSQLRLDIGNLHIPTVSSSWLNLLTLNILNECGYDYKKETVSLVNSYSEMENPFFKILAFMADKNTDISSVEKRLKEYPYPVTDELMVNSHRKDIAFRSKRYFKNTSKTEVKKALPLYELGGCYNLWKRNLLEADRQCSNKGREYFGVDLLQAYWFYEMAKKSKQAQ